MTGEPIPKVPSIVDGTRKECKGVIAGLQQAMDRIDEGGSVHAIVADVPSHIDVRAWAERKGHAVTADGRDNGHFHMVIVKGGKALASPR